METVFISILTLLASALLPGNEQQVENIFFPT